MPEQYPQGLKKNPIVIKNAAGKPVRSFNSYREAIDATDAMKVANSAYDPHYKERWEIAGKKQASNKQASVEGFVAPKVGPFGSVDAGSSTQGKINAYDSAIGNRNQSWMNSVSGAKSTLPSLTKQIMIANGKRK
jgi:hypothetical protein